MARLPVPGSDSGTWGDVLNTYLSVSLAADGTVNSGVIGSSQIATDAVGATQASLPSLAGGMLLTGLLASRPAAGSVNSGFYYLATDTGSGTLFQSNGSSWSQVAAGVIHASQHASNGTDPISPASIGAEATSNKDQANGYAGLDGGGLIKTSELPGSISLLVNNATYVAAPTGTAATDTSSINTAITAAGVNGTLQFAPGTYVINGVTANQSGQHWILRAGTTIQTATGVNAVAITVNAANVVIDGGGTIDGNSTNCTGSSNFGFFFNNAATGSRLEGCVVQNTYQAGVLIYCSQVTIKDNRIINTKGTGIYSQPGTAADVLDLRIEGNRVDKSSQSAATATGYGIQIHAAPGTTNYYQRGLIVSNNRVRMPSSSTNEMICIETWGGCPGVTLSGNKTYGGSMGISADRCDGATIIGNEVYGALQNGIEVASCQEATVSGNTIDGNAVLGGGVVLDGATASSKCTVVGNSIRNLNTGGNAKYIYAIGGDHNTFVGNTTVITAGAGASGLYCQNAPHSSIIGNSFYGNTTNSLYAVTFDGGTCSGTVSGNIFDSWSSANVCLYSGSVATIDNVVLGPNRHVNGTIFKVVGSATVGNNVRYSNIENNVASPGVSAIIVGASPFTYINNDHGPEAVYISGGTVSAIAKNSVTIFASSPGTVWLEPGESVTVTYSAAPTMNKDRK